MQLYKIAASCVIVASFVACQGSKTETIDRSLLPDSTKQEAITTNTTTATGTQPNNVLPFAPTTPVATGNPVITTTTAAQPQPQQVVTTSSAAGLNPAHGLPGYRCDIAVGAPLNSPPTQQSAPVITQQMPTNAAAAASKSTPVAQQMTVTPTPTKTVTAPGMNPPHGEPGHRCDIAVGAPLNSKKADAPVAAPVVQQVQPTAVQAASASDASGARSKPVADSSRKQ